MPPHFTAEKMYFIIRKTKFSDWFSVVRHLLIQLEFFIDFSIVFALQCVKYASNQAAVNNFSADCKIFLQSAFRKRESFAGVSLETGFRVRLTRKCFAEMLTKELQREGKISK